MKICVVIPAYNESKTIGTIVKALRGRGLDVVMIDDGSTDGSGEIARDAGAFVIRHQNKMGKGTSLREGFGHILKEGYEGVITLDGDGQHDVNDIDGFIACAAERQAALIIGNRMVNPKGMPKVRYLTNRFMSALISWAAGCKVPDTQCGYRFISLGLLERMRLQCKDFEIETEIIMKCAQAGLAIESVEIKTIYRDEESKINPVRDTLRFITYFFKEICSRH